MTAQKNGLNKSKLKTIEKLKDKGFDTAAKIRIIDGRLILKNGLTSEMENIFDLQDAIKANHSELAWLMDGEDPKPVRKEEVKSDHDGRHSENRSAAESFSYGIIRYHHDDPKEQRSKGVLNAYTAIRTHYLDIEGK